MAVDDHPPLIYIYCTVLIIFLLLFIFLISGFGHNAHHHGCSHTRTLFYVSGFLRKWIPLCSHAFHYCWCGHLSGGLFWMLWCCQRKQLHDDHSKCPQLIICKHDGLINSWIFWIVLSFSCGHFHLWACWRHCSLCLAKWCWCHLDWKHVQGSATVQCHWTWGSHRDLEHYAEWGKFLISFLLQGFVLTQL